MFGLFKPLAQMFDHNLDKVLEGPAGPGMGKSMGAIGTVIAAALVVCLVSIMIFNAGRKMPPPAVHVVIPDQPPARIRVLDSPSLSVEKITRWSSRAVRDIFRFNFRDVDARMAGNSVYFTPEAYADFMQAMEDSGTIEQVKDQRQFVLLTPMEDAQLVSRAQVGGKMVLRVEIPVLLTYIAGEKPVYQRQWLELFILPVPTTEDPEGLAIAKLQAHPYR